MQKKVLFNQNPPEPFIEPRTPDEWEEELIEEHLYEMNYNDSYVDLEEVRISELIKNEQV